MRSTNWKGFLDSLPPEGRLSKVLLESWRSDTSTLEANARLDVRAVSPEDLDRRLSQNADLISIALPHMSWMTTTLLGIRHVVFLTDVDGIVLHSTGNDSERMAEFALFPGYDYSEKQMGANGAGSAIAHNRPVAVVGPEKISSPIDDCTCTGAPIHAADGRVLGAIAVNTCVSEGTPERLVAVAHTAFVIEQELLHRLAGRANKYQQLQHTTIRILAETYNLPDAATRLLETLSESLGLRWGALWRIDVGGEVMRCVETWHKPDEKIASFDAVTKATALKKGYGLPGCSWELGAPRWSFQLSEDLSPDRYAAAVAAGFHGGFAFPIRNGVQILGAVEFFDGKTFDHDPDFFRAMDTIGSQVGLFIQRREAECALAESQLEYSTLAETVPGILFSATAEGDGDYNSSQFYQYTGAKLFGEQSSSAEGVAEPPVTSDGFNWIEAVHEDDRANVAADWRKAIASGQPFVSEHRIRGKDGSYRWFVARAAPVRNDDGTIRRWCGTAIDIDSQKRAEEALRQSDKRKDEFLGMLAHELRNPLAPIRNALHVMSHPGGDSNALLQAQEMAERQFVHMTRLIDDLLDISRISQGKVRLQKLPVDLRELLQRTCATWQPFFDSSHQRLTVSLGSQPVLVHGDPVRLEQVFSNLLSNANKFTPSGGFVSVDLQQTDSTCVVAISDNGIGIDAELIPHVFELFVQGDNSLDRTKGGLGIGLTLVQKLVELHDGQVAAVSAGAAQGSVFRVQMPVFQPMAQGASSLASNQNASSPMSLRVLVVDDNEDSARTMGMMIRLWKHHVEVAFSGADAIEIAQRYQPHLILLDIGLPKVDGYEVARQINQMTTALKPYIVALTGYGAAEDKKRGHNAGFHDYIVKPASPEQIQSVLTRCASITS